MALPELPQGFPQQRKPIDGSNKNAAPCPSELFDYGSKVL